MKLRILLSTLVLLCFQSSALFAEETTSDAAASEEAKALRVGMIDSKPMAFFNDGEATGFEVELVKEIADEVGYGELSFKKYSSPSAVMSALEEGEIDLGIGGITRTGKRERKIDFVHHHGDFGLAIAVRSDNKDIYTEKDLKGKNVCTKADTTSVPFVKKYGAKITEVSEIDECWPLLENKKVNAIFFDSAPLWHHLKGQEKPKFQVIDKLFAIQYYALLLPNKSEQREDWNIAVADFLFSDPYEALWSKYLGDFE